MKRLIAVLSVLALGAMFLPVGSKAQDVDVRVRVKQPRVDARSVYAPPPPAVYGGYGCREYQRTGCTGYQKSAGCYGSGGCYGTYGAGCYGNSRYQPSRFPTPVRDFLFGR